ncbi:THAP domain-containing protein 11 [Elysia marginata]|uniref:THAP domain-containing protein 11 n=1 Tax=Elysia marginata TaxID=1093978 RepID=A0AAV4J3J1_9GAST|nr:THAP domain-containing protein 11 [Elysia marginata]
MGVACCVAGCKNRCKAGSGICFYRIPKKPESKRRAWLTALTVNRYHGLCKQWEPSPYSRVCNQHFVTGRPHKDANHVDYIPTVNMQLYKNSRYKQPTSLMSGSSKEPQTQNDSVMLSRILNARAFQPKEIEVDTDREDVKPSLDADGNIISYTATPDSPDAQGSDDTLSCPSGSHSPCDPTPSDLNPLLAMTLKRESELRSKRLQLRNTPGTQQRESLDQDFQTVVVNMDSSWPGYSHPELSDQNADTNGSKDFVKSEPGLGGQLMDQETQENHHDSMIDADVNEGCHFEITAKYVMSKLGILTNVQRILAEKLIADVLFEAELGNLCLQSKVNVLGS